jgi:hypothetical protein
MVCPQTAGDVAGVPTLYTAGRGTRGHKAEQKGVFNRPQLVNVHDGHPDGLPDGHPDGGLHTREIDTRGSNGKTLMGTRTDRCIASSIRLCHPAPLHTEQGCASLASEDWAIFLTQLWIFANSSDDLRHGRI